MFVKKILSLSSLTQAKLAKTLCRKFGCGLTVVVVH